MADQTWQLLELMLAVPETATCLAPDCTNPCGWTGRDTPRRMYCSPGCRERTRATRERLEDALVMLREQIQPAVVGDALVDADDLEARIRWVLRRYPAPGWEE